MEWKYGLGFIGGYHWGLLLCVGLQGWDQLLSLLIQLRLLYIWGIPGLILGLSHVREVFSFICGRTSTETMSHLPIGRLLRRVKVPPPGFSEELHSGVGYKRLNWSHFHK